MELSLAPRGLPASLLAVSLCAVACTKEEPSTTHGPGAVQDASVHGHSVRLDAWMLPDEAGADVTFLTPYLSLYTMPASDIAGKPYYVATFQGGFDQGVDLDLHHEWGIVPPDLHVTYTSPPIFPNGPYDVSLIVYTKTQITDEMRADYFGIVPKKGELSAFTLSHDQVRPGDPGFSNGVIRTNVEDADGLVNLENHHDPTNVATSFTDTILTVP